ncbi:NAD(P)-dependent dehydrogenase, short-chain alcohol dehydrogenase family [Marinobacter sp. es.048]|uniref:SDR family NAD(P)-dependent oxidoreductase n=1 Tax=Marinobacter sp. es.048 TaxID=1761795 RepID=UPI000B5881F9|nr:SDR family oxidoreductase [Marinobacter sp. es.048]SNC62633.1 NAD(P)-dependent dehydrogenase, short-chain alcohol dehydrogenase family [Marinobacter sp. es.048]
MKNSDDNSSRDGAFTEGVAIVAGGSGGIGAAVCLSLARAGSDVLLTYNSNEQAAEEVAKAVRDLGRQAKAVKLDLCEPGAVEKIAAAAEQEFGRIHSVVYAAGPAIHFQLISQLAPSEWARVVQTDVGGAFNLVHGTLPYLKKSGGAYAAVITAAVERVPTRDICSAAPKAAIEMLFRGVAKEEGRHSVRANCVGPGWVDAGLGSAVMQNELTSEHIEKIKKAIPLRRVGQAGEIAEAVTFLLSSKASYITGQSLAVDGGMQA